MDGQEAKKTKHDLISGGSREDSSTIAHLRILTEQEILPLLGYSQSNELG